MELRAPPPPLLVADRLHGARVARRKDAKAGRELGDLVSVVLEHQYLVRELTEEVATVVDPDREEAVLAGMCRLDRAAGEERLELHSRADAEHRPAR